MPCSPNLAAARVRTNRTAAQAPGKERSRKREYKKGSLKRNMKGKGKPRRSRNPIKSTCDQKMFLFSFRLSFSFQLSCWSRYWQRQELSRKALGAIYSLRCCPFRCPFPVSFLCSFPLLALGLAALACWSGIGQRQDWAARQ